MTNAASRLSRSMGAVTRNIGGGGGRTGGGGNPRAIEEVVTRAINRAMSKLNLRLQASVPRVKNDKVFHTRNLRNIYRQTPQPPDYTGGFEGYHRVDLLAIPCVALVLLITSLHFSARVSLSSRLT